MKLQQWALAVNVVTTAILGLAFVPALIMAPFSLMFFDGGHSIEAWVAFLIIFTLPFTILAVILAIWLWYARKKYRAALYVALIYLLYLGLWLWWA